VDKNGLPSRINPHFQPHLTGKNTNMSQTPPTPAANLPEIKDHIFHVKAGDSFTLTYQPPQLGSDATSGMYICVSYDAKCLQRVSTTDGNFLSHPTPEGVTLYREMHPASPITDTFKVLSAPQRATSVLAKLADTPEQLAPNAPELPKGGRRQLLVYTILPATP
jgi:hypothetical protein